MHKLIGVLDSILIIKSSHSSCFHLTNINQKLHCKGSKDDKSSSCGAECANVSTFVLLRERRLFKASREVEKV